MHELSRECLARVIQTQQEQRAAIAQEFYDEVCRQAEQNMLKTGVLSGAHYAAMQSILKLWQEQAQTQEVS